MPNHLFSECPSTTVRTFTEKNESTTKVSNIGSSFFSLTYLRFLTAGTIAMQAASMPESAVASPYVGMM